MKVRLDPRAAAASLALGLLLGGCAPEHGADKEAGAWASPPSHLEGPEIRIGSPTDSAYAFGFVRTLAVAPNGTLYSIHANPSEIRLWTADGKPAGSVGREGEGPGEFRSPMALGFFGDTLWVMDGFAYRVSLFSPEGEYLGGRTPTVRLSEHPEDRHSPPRPVRPLRDGTFYGISPAWSDAIARSQLDGVPHVHMDADGATLDTLWWQAFEPHDILALLRESGGTFGQQPFGDGSLVTLSPAEKLVVLERRVPDEPEGAAFRLTMLAMSGDTLTRRAYPYTPVPLPTALVDSMAHVQAEQWHGFMTRFDQGATVASLERDIRTAMYAPRFFPPVHTLVAADDGSIWLGGFSREGQAREWKILDASGSPRGRVLAPAGLRIMVVRGDQVWGVEMDELDVSYIVRYQVVRGEG